MKIRNDQIMRYNAARRLLVLFGLELTACGYALHIRPRPLLENISMILQPAADPTPLLQT